MCLCFGLPKPAFSADSTNQNSTNLIQAQASQNRVKPNIYIYIKNIVLCPVNINNRYYEFPLPQDGIWLIL